VRELPGTPLTTPESPSHASGPHGENEVWRRMLTDQGDRAQHHGAERDEEQAAHQPIEKLYRNREPRWLAHRAVVTRNWSPCRLIVISLCTMHRNRNVAGVASAGGLGVSTL
jgi:hypothetical protein